MDRAGTNRFEPLNMKKEYRRPLRWLALAAFLLLVSLVWLALKAREETPPAAGGSWHALSAEIQTLELMTSGKLMPAQVVEIASPAAGVIETLQVAVGDTVKQGDLLGRIGSAELEAQLRTAQVALLRGRLQEGSDLSDGAPTELLNAQRRLLAAQKALSTARALEIDSRELYNKGIVSRNDDEASKNAVTDAEMQVAQAQEELKATQRKFAPDQLQALALEQANKQADLAQIDERKKRLSLFAPLSGVVLYPQPTGARGGEGPRELAVGARVAADESILAIGDTSSFLIKANATEAEFAWLQEGAETEVTLTSLPQEIFKTQVVKVLGQTRNRSGAGFGGESYEFLVALPAPGQSLPAAFVDKIRMGGTAKLKVTQKGTSNQTTVPTAAVLWAPDGSAQVRWRASADDAPEMKSVRVARSGLGDVVLRDELAGEVWVPEDAAASVERGGWGLRRLLGWEE